MLVGHDERVPIARLLTFLEHGERMARDCAKAQAALSEDSGTRRFAFSDLFESLAEDPAAWAQDVRNFLPEWLREEPIAVGSS